MVPAATVTTIMPVTPVMAAIALVVVVMRSVPGIQPAVTLAGDA